MMRTPTKSAALPPTWESNEAVEPELMRARLADRFVGVRLLRGALTHRARRGRTRVRIEGVHTRRLADAGDVRGSRLELCGELGGEVARALPWAQPSGSSPPRSILRRARGGASAACR